MRILREPLRGGGDADSLEELDRPLARGGASDPPVPQQHLGKLRADRIGGIERGHRLLEDHRHPVAAQVGHRALAQPQQIDAVEYELLRLAPRMLGQQVH
jgi:hypothetical protein